MSSQRPAFNPFSNVSTSGAGYTWTWHAGAILPTAVRAAATDRPPSPETMRADSDLDLTVGRELHDRQDRAVEAHHNEEDETDPRAVACGFARYEGQPDKYYDEDEGVGAVARCYECGTAVDFNDPEDAYYDEEAEAWFCAECS